MAGKSKLAIREPVADPGGWWWGSGAAGAAAGIQGGGAPSDLDRGGWRRGFVSCTDFEEKLAVG